MLTRVALVSILLALAPPVFAADDLTYGPHAVGFRRVQELDRSRTLRARTTFDGRPIEGDPAMPIDIGVWYPAQPGGTRMTAGDYRALSRGGTADREAMARDWRTMLGFAGVSPSETELLSALDRPRRAARDAVPLGGRHPVIIGGMGGPAGCATLAEYLASHGYVVVSAPALQRTGTQQASAPLLALETQTRNLEYLLAFAHTLPFADDTRLGVVGINFDGMAALIFQMRNMRADAVVSMDGWEGKKGGAETMRESPYLDVVRLRVPYLVFEQDEPSVPATLAHDRSLWASLKYSPRQWFVLRNFGHLFLTTDQFAAPGLTAATREGYAFLYSSVLDFLDAHVRKMPRVDRPSTPAIVKEAYAEAAIAAAPTGEEFENLVMAGPIDRAVAIFRRARADNPDLLIADERTLDLFAFRFNQQKKRAEVRALRELAAEAFTESARAGYNLAVARTEAGDAAGARAAWERTRTLIDADPRLSAAEKDRMRADVRQRLGG